MSLYNGSSRWSDFNSWLYGSCSISEFALLHLSEIQKGSGFGFGGSDQKTGGHNKGNENKNRQC